MRVYILNTNVIYTGMQTGVYKLLAGQAPRTPSIIPSSLNSPTHAQECVIGVYVPDYYAWVQKVSLQLETSFAPSEVIERHQMFQKI